VDSNYKISPFELSRPLDSAASRRQSRDHVESASSLRKPPAVRTALVNVHLRLAPAALRSAIINKPRCCRAATADRIVWHGTSRASCAVSELANCLEALHSLVSGLVPSRAPQPTRDAHKGVVNEITDKTSTRKSGRTNAGSFGSLRSLGVAASNMGAGRRRQVASAESNDPIVGPAPTRYSVRFRSQLCGMARLASRMLDGVHDYFGPAVFRTNAVTPVSNSATRDWVGILVIERFHVTRAGEHDHRPCRHLRLGHKYGENERRLVDRPDRLLAAHAAEQVGFAWEVSLCEAERRPC